MANFDDLNWNPGDCGDPSNRKVFLDFKAWKRMEECISEGNDSPVRSFKESYDGWMVNNFKEDFLITFIKKDGTERTLHVTHDIPEDKKPKGIKPIKENQDVLRVFVKDLQEWRSIRYDSILTLRSV